MKFVKLISCLVLVLAFSSAAAQEVKTPPTAFDGAALSATPIIQHIPFLVKQETPTIVDANITDLQPEAIKVGLGKMVIQGTKEENLSPDGVRNVIVKWNSAYLVGEDGVNRRTTHISIPLESDFDVIGEVPAGTKVTAEGFAEELVAAWERLQEQSVDLIPEDTASEDGQSRDQEVLSSGSGESTDAEERPAEFTSPSFDVVNPPLIETLTCPDLRMDYGQEAAIGQEHTLQDGVEIIPCQDAVPAVRYPLTRDYTACSLEPVIADLKAYKRYVYFYNDPETGEKAYADPYSCTRDESQFYVINDQDTSGCGIVDDFVAGVSNQQIRTSYTVDGVVSVLIPCHDSSITYAHNELACANFVDEVGGLVIKNHRYSINVGDVNQYISECEPYGSAIAIQEEGCTSPEFTDDFIAGQSARNKNYYYMDGVSRVNVSNCVQSTEVYTHKQDTSVCTAANDDVNKETTVMGKTYIEYPTSSDKTYVSTGCQSISPKIPYAILGGQWRSSSQLSNQDMSQGADSSVYYGSMTGRPACNAGYGAGVTDGWWAGFEDPWSTLGNYGKRCTGIEMCFAEGLAYDGTHWCFKATTSGANAYATGKNVCVTKTQPATWVTTGGVTLDKTNSDASPTLSLISRSVSMSGFLPIVYVCTNRCSTVTNLEKNPVYLRADGSQWVDTSTITGTKAVCGTGSLVIGTIE